MIEGRTAVADPEIAQLIQRLQSTRERWYARGKADGKRWAVSTASRQELWRVKDELEGEEGAELAEYVTRRHGRAGQVFGGYDFQEAINRWLREDQGGSSSGSGSGASAEFRFGDEEDEDDGRPKPTAPASKPEVDLAGYMEGWRDVVDEIWQVVSAALR